jgi:pimeloyl-ACP methyl ester carboxylesterase
MVKYIKYQDTNIRFSDRGNGKPIVLLHGFHESIDVWGEFGEELSKSFRIIAIDLLGHGETGNISSTHTVEMMADAVYSVINSLKMPKATIVGHSMGGYVTMAFCKKYPEKVNGYIMLNSSVFADTEEKSEGRSKEIELIKEGKKDLIVNININKAFAYDNILRFKEEVENSRQIALNTTNKGAIAALEGMKIRPDYAEFFKNDTLPKMVIYGLKDNHVPAEKSIKMCDLNYKTKEVSLDNSGHMAFVEDKDIVVKKVIDFINS